MKFIYICLLALTGSTFAAKTNLRAQGFINDVNKEIDTNVNGKLGKDLILNLGTSAA